MSKRKGILLIGAVFVLAAAGVVYAHWTETLTVDASVATGSASLAFLAQPHTDDDHVNNGAWEGVDETAAQEGTDYDRYPGTSSNDPSAAYANSRYTKDVARCAVTGWTADTITAVVENGYPSYWCTIRSDDEPTGLRNVGSVPMKDQAMRVEVCEADCGNPASWVSAPYNKANDRFWYDGDADTYPELQFASRPQNWCGRQWDPGYTAGYHVFLHIEQDAAQGATYQIRFTFEWVNWNEWSLSSCYGYDFWGTHTVPGSGPLYPIP